MVHPVFIAFLIFLVTFVVVLAVLSTICRRFVYLSYDSVFVLVVVHEGFVRMFRENIVAGLTVSASEK